ncbi:hypothetical protein BDR05DRAFT_832916, partial [Suillus weaverae]
LAITGSSTGFGRAMVGEVLLSGEIAVAILRKPSVLDDLVAKHPRTQFLVFLLDMINEGQVSAGGDTNGQCQGAGFWGAVTVSFEAVRFFRDVSPQGARGMVVRVL